VYSNSANTLNPAEIFAGTGFGGIYKKMTGY